MRHLARVPEYSSPKSWSAGFDHVRSRALSSVVADMRTGIFITRGLSTLALTATAIASTIVPANAADASLGATKGVTFDLIVREDTAPGEAPKFEVVTTDLGGVFSLLSDPALDVEFDGTAELMWRPDDPDYLSQWEHHVTGIETAWDTTRGSSETVIAVVDSGVVPEAEFGTRLLPGISFIGTDPNVDPLGHGTAVASVAAAGANNGFGGVGACPECSILPVQVADSTGSVPWSAAANGVVWATDNGADIINLSFGSQINSSILADAVAYAISRDVIVIGAAGNYGSTVEVFPGALPDVISVAGHDFESARYSWSSYGSWVDIAAPGCARAIHGGGVTAVCGTSFSAPWVSGAVGLLLTDAGALTQAQVETILQASTIPNDFVETGRVDASVLIGAGYADLVGVRSKVSAREVTMTGEYRGDVVQVDLVVDGAVTDTSSALADGSFSLMWDARQAVVGTYQLQVDAYASDGATSRSQAVTVEVIENSGFDDVVTNAFYEAGVEWMVAEAITSGTSATTFSPEAQVTRGQLATFLWRFAGRPQATVSANFDDTDPGAYYADGVAWMVEQAITTGTTATTFSPDEGVTRGQLAAFLYRYAGRPAVGLTSSFDDVGRSDYFAVPVDFMVEQQVTTGTTPTTFSPDAPVTRGQLATFLWRFAGKPII